MKLSRALSAGLLDSGFASLATFALNLYAIGRWEDNALDVLGIYFLFMTAFFMASAIPYQLLYIPAEKASLILAPAARLGLMLRVIVLSLPTAVLSGALVAITLAVGLVKGFTFGEQVPFLVTAGLAAVFSPMQNYARRLLHLAGRSWSAATVSIVQFAVAIGGLFVLLAFDVPARWLPIGALALANFVSVGVALVMSHRAVGRLSPEESAAVARLQDTITHRSLATSGRWLVTTSLLSTGTNFIVESIITLLAGAVALALAGSAKTVAQPILVLANGLRSVLGPKSMETAGIGDRAAARRISRTFSRLTAIAVVLYSALAGWSWFLNPLAALVEQAYTVPGLVLLSIIAAGLNGAAFSGRMELIGAGRETDLLRAEVATNSMQLATATVAAALSGAVTNLGAFARPIAFAVLGGGRIVLYDRALEAYYRARAVAARPFGGGAG